MQLFQIVLFQGETLKKVEDTILKLFPFRYCWQTECLHTYPTHQTVTRLKAKIMVSHKETQNLDHLSVVKTEHVSSVTDKYLTLWLLSSLESSNWFFLTDKCHMIKEIMSVVFQVIRYLIKNFHLNLNPTIRLLFWFRKSTHQQKSMNISCFTKN